MKNRQKETAERHRTRRRLLIVTAAVLLVFGCLHFGWKLFCEKPYAELAKNMNPGRDEYSPEAEGAYYCDIGEYRVCLSMPPYMIWKGGGFLSIGNRKNGHLIIDSESGDIYSENGLEVTLFIWPTPFSNDMLGLWFDDQNNSIFEQYDVTRDLSLVDEEKMNDERIARAYSLIEEKRDEINELFRVAEEELGLDLR